MDEPPINHLVTPSEMMESGLALKGYSERRIKRAKGKTNVFRFKHHFGVSPCTAVWVYTDMQITNIAGAKIKGGILDLKYFLIGLYYLRKYPTEEELTSQFDYSNYWVREKAWGTIEKIQLLKHQVIVWEDDYQQGKRWVMTVDGIHCWINEPSHKEWSQDPKYYSHKYNKAGLDYELGISLVDNRLLWMRGPFPAGTNDITIFREKGLLDELKKRKQSAIGDRGYNGEPKHMSTYNAHDNAGVRLFKSRALKRHENFNSLLKQNKILDTRFRHNEDRFASAFEACCVLAQYRITREMSLYDILIEDVVDTYEGDK
ncbi:unnamed protein product [Cylindrotheca closterium]|uniref:DDE Tnp4 domain-containing protein n=2 Tax=Cylindrotheca closterium TaxID=2856 RepID=A0AAD2FXP1_9STRA|nr:unnamed protein product [Cylindrotheca closterium]